MKTDEPLPTRQSLLDRVKNTGDQASWGEFHRIYRGLIVGVARRAGLNEHEAEEVVQDTFIALAKKLPEFRYKAGQDSFKGWLLQLTHWKITDQLRKRARSVGPALSDDNLEEAKSSAMASESTVSAPPGFIALWDAEWEQYLLNRALALVKRQVNPEHYAIYHLHVIEAGTVAEVRRTLGVSTPSIYLAKHRVGAALRKELRRLRKIEL